MAITSHSAPLMDKAHVSALMQAIQGAEICVLYQSVDLIHRWAENLPDILKEKWSIGCRDSDFLSVDQSEMIETLKLQVLATGKRQTLEVRFEDSARQIIWYKFSIDCHRDEHGDIIGVLTTGVNVSELRRREQVLKVLLREVSHRSKNLLAIIQSIAGQTARHSGTIKDFLLKFRGRIQSLSHSQDLVTDSDWRGAQFHELLRTQIAGYFDTDNCRFSVEGKDPYLFPSAALHIGLAFHELIVNSLSYGALSQANGRVVVSSQVEYKEKETPNLIISWLEIFDSLNAPTKEHKASFGSAVLEKIVPTSVNGTASLTFRDNGLYYELTIPNTYFDIFPE
ncbi:sensor histidine kinase [Bartonella tamiae]|uniref:histidine kinase n=1 Tax=Bartonella tamiae Th239 TaxID=1094558 RepID=J1K2B9_9HYPH|nr:PAS domain-containing sensor histidine kinase [Bartonella tamiae]EJF91627.1 hypothetical protein ME5_00006 [Bartonella tamiae Th239]EJF92698.1 hypothetical protein MEG_01868 [Bartonella tamiae Th307]